MPLSSHHLLNLSARNSGPLSTRICLGYGLTNAISSKTSITFWAGSENLHVLRVLLGCNHPELRPPLRSALGSYVYSPAHQRRSPCSNSCLAHWVPLRDAWFELVNAVCDDGDASNLAVGRPLEPFCGSTLSLHCEVSHSSRQSLLPGRLPHMLVIFQSLADHLFCCDSTTWIDVTRLPCKPCQRTLSLQQPTPLVPFVDKALQLFFDDILR